MKLSRILVVIGALMLCGVSIALAADAVPVTLDTLTNFVQKIIDTFFEIAALAVMAFIVYGGIKMATAGGDTAKFKSGKDTLINALWGGLVVFGVGVIVNTIARFAQNPTGFN